MFDCLFDADILSAFQNEPKTISLQSHAQAFQRALDAATKSRETSAAVLPPQDQLIPLLEAAQIADKDGSEQALNNSRCTKQPEVNRINFAFTTVLNVNSKVLPYTVGGIRIVLIISNLDPERIRNEIFGLEQNLLLKNNVNLC